MPHISLRGSTPIQERSGRNLVLMFVIVPWGFGIALLTILGVSWYEFRANFTTKDWLAAAWGVMLALALMVGLPVAAWQEWQRRKQFRRPGSARSHSRSARVS